MLCRTATSLLTEAEEGELRGVKKALFELHLTVCAPCKRYRAQLRTTVAVLGGMPREESAPPELLDVLAKSLDEKK